MNRLTALVIVGLFALAALAVAIWGGRDLLLWITEFRACRDIVLVDSSSYWFLGLISISLLPGLAILPDRLHGVLFAILISLFFALPGAAAMIVNRTASDQGYDSNRLPSMFELREVRLRAPDKCRPASN